MRPSTLYFACSIFLKVVGKSRIRHRTTLNLNDAISNQFWVDLEIQFQSRSMSDPTLSEINFKILPATATFLKEPVHSLVSVRVVYQVISYTVSILQSVRFS